jgi:predicted enzyme related to lactoylglutathione lyase
MNAPDIHMTLGWVIAYVDDPPATSTFYQQTFGLRNDFAAPGRLTDCTLTRSSG